MPTPVAQPTRIQFTGSNSASLAVPLNAALVVPADPMGLLDLLPEWQLALRAEAKARGTIDVDIDGAHRYLTWCQSTDLAPLVRTTLQSWMAHLLEVGNAPGTVRTRHQAVRRLAAWLRSTGRLPVDPFVGIKGPVQHPPVVTPLRDDELRALIGTCTNPTFRTRTDMLVRYTRATAAERAAQEARRLNLGDLDIGRSCI